VGCDSTCKVETGYTCVLQVEPNQCYECGNGKIEITETCDDGNTGSSNFVTMATIHIFVDDGCSSTCTIEPNTNCTGQPSVCVTCGDGKIGSGEACDDGNSISGDGCTSCKVDRGYLCYSSPAPSTCTPICGDGILIIPEACDDNNTSSNDGCSSSCTVESGWTCPGIYRYIIESYDQETHPCARLYVVMVSCLLAKLATMATMRLAMDVTAHVLRRQAGTAVGNLVDVPPSAVMDY
jgi:cysteine-rich repeat protein